MGRGDGAGWIKKEIREVEGVLMMGEKPSLPSRSDMQSGPRRWH